MRQFSIRISERKRREKELEKVFHRSPLRSVSSEKNSVVALEFSRFPIQKGIMNSCAYWQKGERDVKEYGKEKEGISFIPEKCS